MTVRMGGKWGKSRKDQLAHSLKTQGRKSRLSGTRSLCVQSPVPAGGGEGSKSHTQSNYKTGGTVWFNQREREELVNGLAKGKAISMEAPEVGVQPLRKFLEGFQLEIRLQCVGGQGDGKG